jgi:hypothetical protein
LTGWLPDGAVACLAGRRIDASDADPVRFPAGSEAPVRDALAKAFAVESVRHLVCSAACGADIIALEECEASGIPATIVLPFDAPAFRRLSVTDRKGDWGPRFDRLLARARGEGMLIQLALRSDDPDAFQRANEMIVSTAAGLAAAEHLAVIVWDGEKVGEEDVTAHVRDLATAKGFRFIEVTIPK